MIIGDNNINYEWCNNYCMKPQWMLNASFWPGVWFLFAKNILSVNFMRVFLNSRFCNRIYFSSQQCIKLHTCFFFLIPKYIPCYISYISYIICYLILMMNEWNTIQYIISCFLYYFFSFCFLFFSKCEWYECLLFSKFEWNCFWR